ncbi:MAG: sulfatase-like hydrolase/transferase [Rhodocyclaceae bacterium]|nr:sulfatase-like hydrolase/transferase [Rhodocyclaceae bacterium]
MLANLINSRHFLIPARVLLSYIALNALVRFGLLIFNGDFSLLMPQRVIPMFAIGAVFDLAAGVWWLPLIALVTVLWPANWTRSFRIVTGVLMLIVCASLTFVAVSEFFFWNEFASRFNFIAVDYLIYTREVIGNIRESYDLRPAFIGIGLLTVGLFYTQWRGIKGASNAPVLPWRKRFIGLAIIFALPVLSFFLIEPRYKEFSDDTQAVQLAGNGHYEFFSAFRNNEIDYAQFYRSDAVAKAYKILRGQFEILAPANFHPASPMPIEREIVGRGPRKNLNVVLISVESLSAEFMAAFGNKENLTPNLDKLASESLFFTKFYATGLRTVRGLEAITLSIPPTPGNSIVKRPHNANLFTLGEVFKQNGYEPLYIYGGYGYFDNMNAFFGGNGYTVIDRTSIKKEDIHAENIWGVADEDLFTLALQQIDQRDAIKKPFYAHIMTTTNHRPYTYPNDRIDIPSGTGRGGAVKYTDWAIGDFLRQARLKPWFANTVFVILADHTASGRGKTDLPIGNFHIPMLIWSPGNIEPATIKTLSSQIDVGPTLLALLNFSYRSKFFGHDILHDGLSNQRAFMANYQSVGYLEHGTLIELRPQRRWRALDADSGKEIPANEAALKSLDEAVSYYQSASEAFRAGTLSNPEKP